ncbi:hypothetical protein LSAT2_012313, partial [Lamellibrachia satsuma]
MVTSTRNYYQPLPIMYAICGKIFMEIRMRFKLEVGLRICGGIPKAAVVRSNPFSDESDEPRASPCTGRTAYRNNLRAIATVREYKYTKLESKSDDAKAAPIATRRHSPDDEFPECRQSRPLLVGVHSTAIYPATYEATSAGYDLRRVDPVAALPGPQPRLAPLPTRGRTNSAPSVCDTEYVTKNTALKMVTGTRNYYQPLPIMYAIFGKIFMETRKRSKLEVGLRMCGIVPKATVLQSNSFSDESDATRASSCTGRTALAQLRRYSDDATNGKC